MKKLKMSEKCKLIATVLDSDLTPEEKAEKLSILKDDYEIESFAKMTFRDLYIAILDNLGIEKYTGDDALIKHVAKVL
ncbi:hypothetical protein ACWOA2_07775 [Granulicatella elegans]